MRPTNYLLIEDTDGQLYLFILDRSDNIDAAIVDAGKNPDELNSYLAELDNGSTAYHNWYGTVTDPGEWYNRVTDANAWRIIASNLGSGREIHHSPTKAGVVIDG